MKQIEKKLSELLNFLKSYISNNGFPPSYREIGKSIGITSTNTIKYYIDKLEQRNLIARNDGKNRSIQILTDDFNQPIQAIVNLPLLGNIAAGAPLLAETNLVENFTISKNLFGTEQNLFMLKIVGDSMMEIGICNGDTVIAKVQNNADNGDIVVAMLESGATVKTFYKENGHIRLQPQNKSYLPIYEDNLKILGKVIGCLKRY